jgi:short-subunit dehydrogenase
LAPLARNRLIRLQKMNFRRRRVLVTGASSGLGAEIARQLAGEHGADLVLVARRADRLEELSAELVRAHGVDVQCITADLAQPGEAVRVFQEASAKGLYAAVLSAGVTHFGHYDEQSWEALSSMLALNVESTVRLTTLLLPHLEQRGEGGGLLLVASLSGLTPAAYQAAYSGTKGFLVKYGWALHHELAPRGVTVSVFAPGGVATEMTAGPRFDSLRFWLLPAPFAARAALVGFTRRRHLIVPGIIYDWGRTLVLKILPENFLVGRVAAQYRRSLEKNARSAALLELGRGTRKKA